MKDHIKAFQFSLLVHILIILSLLTVSTRLMTREPLMVIDLSTLEIPEKGTQDHMVTNSEKILSNSASTEQKNLMHPSAPELPLQYISQKTVEEETKSTSTDTQATDFSEGNPENVVASTPARSVEFTTLARGNLLSENGEGKQSDSQYTPSHQYPLYFKNNFLYIRNLIQKNITYPLVARQMGWQGKVTVSFLILSDGRISDIKVKQSSGKDILDKNAVETVKRASPFPPPPDKAEITVPVVYALH